MLNVLKSGRINLKVLAVLVTVLMLLAAGAMGGHFYRKRTIATQALSQGHAAAARQDWPEAAKNYRRYLSKYANNLPILEKYAQAEMSISPMEANNVAAAISAYRRVLRLDQDNLTAYKQLAMLYMGIGNFTDLAYIARKRLEHEPADPAASIWLVNALISQHKQDRARKVLTGLLDKLDQQETKHVEYITACGLLSTMVAADGSPQGPAQAGKWLDLAVKYDPESPRALLNRARFYRLNWRDDKADRQSALAAAAADLELADELEPADPRVRLAMCKEWMELGGLDQASAQLDAVKDIDAASLKKYFLDRNDWEVAKFLRLAELLLRKGAVAEGAALADKLLSTLQYKRQLVKVLPPAITLYVASNRVEDASARLDEYLDTLHLTQTVPKSREKVALLQAAVAQAQNMPYRVIEVLQPIAQYEVSRAVVWKLLAQAYSQTDQRRRAIGAIRRYLTLQPRDHQMMIRLARIYIRQGNWDRALEIARLAQLQDPAAIAIKLIRIDAGINIEAAKDNKAARAGLENRLKELNALQESNPQQMAIRSLKAAAQISLGLTDAAEQQLTQAIEQYSDTLQLELQLANLYFKSNRLADAIDVCRNASKRHPQAAVAWLGLARLQQAQGHYDQAGNTLKAGMDAVSDPWEKHKLAVKFALIDILHGDRVAGIEFLKRWAAENKRDVPARTLLLELPEIRKDQALGQELVDQIRQIEGQSGLQWRLYQASLWLTSSDWRAKQQDIIDVLERCIEADPAWPAAVAMLGNTQQRLGNLSDAEVIYRQALAADPGSVEITDRLVTLLERQKRFSEAKGILENIQDTSDVLAAHRVAVALGAGELSEAIDLLKLRIAGDAQDAASRVLLARLLYQQTSDTPEAFKYLDQAQAISQDLIAILALRVSILKSEGRIEQAREILDALVKRDNTFKPYMLRGAFLAGVGLTQLAEKDFLKLTTFASNGAGHELLGSFYAENNRLDDAIVTWREGMDSHPENLSLKRRLLKALLLRGKADDQQRAVELLVEMEALLPGDPDLMWIRALLLLARDDQQSAQEARELLEKIVQLQPSAVDAYLGLIGMAVRDGNYRTAGDLAVRALGANPNNTKLLLARATAEQALNNLILAAELARMVLAYEPDNAPAGEILVQTAISTKDAELLAQANWLLDQQLDLQTTEAQIHWSKAMVLNAMGQTNLAIEKLTKYTQTDAGSKSAAAWLGLAMLHRTGGQLDLCQQYIDNAAQLGGDSAAVVREKILLLGAENKLEEISQLIASYQLEHPDRIGVISAGASLLSASDQQSHLEQAKLLFEHIVETKPNDIQARLSAASLAYRTGQIRQAQEAYDQILKSHPANVQALNDLAWILAHEQGDYQAAVDLANKGIKLAPRNIHLRDTRGVIFSNMPGKLNEARKDFQQAVELAAPDSAAAANALLKLARVCARLEDWTLAADYALKAKQIDSQKGLFSPQQQAEIEKLTKGRP